MGSILSRSECGEQWGWRGPPGQHSPYPLDRIPRPPIHYCFVDIIASYKIVDYRINLGPTAVSTDVDDYVQELRQCCRAGYRLIAFCRVPGLHSTTVRQDWTLVSPYQAIFIRTAQASDKELCIEKSILSPGTMHVDTSVNDNHMLNTIHRYASVGGRLLAACPVGYVEPDTPNKQYRVAGLELFFETPAQRKSSDLYTYHAIKIPASYRVCLDSSQTIQKVVCNADFKGQLSVYLNQGWKLIDICMDTSALTEVFRKTNGLRVVDTVWIFEKEAHRLHDNTAQYEGAIIEYIHKVKLCRRHGERPSRDWRPVIAGMGALGWELAAVVQAPSLVQSSFRTYAIKMMFIFQRPLFKLPEYNGQVNVLPPVYELTL